MEFQLYRTTPGGWECIPPKDNAVSSATWTYRALLRAAVIHDVDMVLGHPAATTDDKLAILSDALIIAAMVDLPDLATKIVSEFPDVDVNGSHVDPARCTAITFAFLNRRTDLIRLLLAKGANLDSAVSTLSAPQNGNQ